MNRICTEQNSDVQLERLAAQRALYARAKRVFLVHALLSTVVAGALSFISQSHEDVKPYAALLGCVLCIVDVCCLTPWQKTLRETAARIQESFDCSVLRIPWNYVKLGKPVEPETVVEYARHYQRTDPAFESLRDWYPANVCRIPLPLARVVCQRTNAWWDGKQRLRYAYFLLGTIAVLLLGLATIGVARHMALPDLLLTTMVPLTSGIALALRQYKENADAAGGLDKLRDHAADLWTAALGGASEEELAASCRALQDELFDSRKRSVPVFDRIYWLLRGDHEIQMHEAAAKLVSEFEATRNHNG